MQTSAGGLAESSLYIWYSDDPLGVVNCQGDCLVPLPLAIDQERNQIGNLRGAEAGDRVPTRCRFESSDVHEAVVARGDVVERRAVGVTFPDVIERLVDRSEPMPRSLVGQGDDSGPLGRPRAGAGHNHPVRIPEGNEALGRICDVGHPSGLVVFLEWRLPARTAEQGAETPSAR